MLKSHTGSILEAAENYIAKGWAVMPCLPSKKEPHFGLIRRSHLDATKDLDLVKFWLKMDSEMNLGISAIASVLVILDVDYRNGGVLDPQWDRTFTVKTPDGYHLYYSHNDASQYRSGLGDGIDIKYKGYVVAAPSIHPTGAHYQIIDDTDVTALPKMVEEAICRPTW